MVSRLEHRLQRIAPVSPGCTRPRGTQTKSYAQSRRPFRIMKTTIICPAHRPGIAFLAARRPLILLPVLGRTLLDRFLADVFQRGLRSVSIGAADRPEVIREALRNGEPWGLDAELTPLVDEPPELPGTDLLDHLPGSMDSAFTDYRAWFATIRTAFFHGGVPRLGMREVSPGVWIHARAKVDPTASLAAPCWVGERVQVGPGAQLGPGAYIEDDCFIERGAAIEETWVGPGTYVGAFTELLDSLAWGHTLCKWTTGAVTEVADAFLLSALQPAARPGSASLVGRSAAVVAILATLPIAGVALVMSFIRRTPFLEKREALLPDGSCAAFAEFGGLRGRLRRWPRLLAIARGSFAWFGNPPLSRAEAENLHGEFERLWLAVPPGLFSLADAMGCSEQLDDEAKAHAGYYAACRSPRQNVRIVRSLFKRIVSSAGGPR